MYCPGSRLVRTTALFIAGIGPQSHRGKPARIIEEAVLVGQFDGASETFKTVIKSDQEYALRRANAFYCNSELACVYCGSKQGQQNSQYCSHQALLRFGSGAHDRTSLNQDRDPSTGCCGIHPVLPRCLETSREPCKFGHWRSCLVCRSVRSWASPRHTTSPDMMRRIRGHGNDMDGIFHPRTFL